MTKRLWILMGLVFALAPILAFAVDGQILINQSTVMAAGGFPYNITQPGSYKLSGNLAVPVGSDAIHVAASNVTLDLNGFSITSTNVTLSPFIYGVTSVGGPSGITIRNGKIRGFLIPIQPDFGTPSSFLNLAKFWILEDLVLEETGATVGQIFFGSYTRIWHVHDPNDSLGVTCPSIVVETTATNIVANHGSSGNCAFVNNATLF